MTPPRTPLEQLLVEFRNDAELARVGHYGMSADVVLLYLNQIKAALASVEQEPAHEARSPDGAGSQEKADGQ